MGRKKRKTKEEIDASLAPNEARRKALRETGLSREHIRNVVSGAAAEAKGAAKGKGRRDGVEKRGEEHQAPLLCPSTPAPHLHCRHPLPSPPPPNEGGEGGGGDYSFFLRVSGFPVFFVFKGIHVEVP